MKRSVLSRTAETIILLMVCVIVLFPIIWMFLTSLKSPKDAYSISLDFAPSLQNFVTIFSHPWNLGHALWNSTLVAGATVVIAIPAATLAAYSFSRFQMKGRKSLFFIVLSTQFVPAVVIVLPFFLMFRNLGLLDTRLALVIVNVAITTPFVIWMIKGFFDAIPLDSEEAAMMDGASRLRVILDVVLPMARPGIITAAIFSFILTWNEFLFALILTRRYATTLPVALTNFRTERGDLWELMSAAGVLITVPIFLLAMVIQKHFTRGMTAGAVK
ncbi:multiple sugar transport system permease protein [Paenochrobactrum gallinarii]|uniref:Maltose/maltodextrin transport system permease protein MalG n=1 Tax=Paenochrobactrum gallinarii TaxID=643673 RepID=A0A841M8T9_9HYPH|nr:carbohydrate ABC transporter permease [Paenochrobactrum gallinarii]MBB6262641.1 multiple sugar transport system permease protein [Paenochrobactrum gallinarii]